MEDITQAIQRSKRACAAKHSRNYRIKKKARKEEVRRELKERTHC
jgi:hypothetical protein